MTGLRKQQDAFGWEIWDHLHKRPSQEIVERDDGYIDVSSGAANYFAEHADWPAYEKEPSPWRAGACWTSAAGPGASRCISRTAGWTSPVLTPHRWR